MTNGELVPLQDPDSTYFFLDKGASLSEMDEKLIESRENSQMKCPIIDFRYIHDRNQLNVNIGDAASFWASFLAQLPYVTNLGFVLDKDADLYGTIPEFEDLSKCFLAEWSDAVNEEGLPPRLAPSLGLWQIKSTQDTVFLERNSPNKRIPLSGDVLAKLKKATSKFCFLSND